MSKIVLMVFFGLLVVSSSFADAACSYVSYAKSCQYCDFDENGKMDPACYHGYESGGKSCVATSYPIASAAYSQGKCPQMDSCAADLQRCKAMVTSGNDETDCSQSYIRDCFSVADGCMEAAAKECGDQIKICPFAFILSAILGIGFIKYGKIRRS